jgi:hypothetical protein
VISSMEAADQLLSAASDLPVSAERSLTHGEHLISCNAGDGIAATATADLRQGRL